MDNSDKTRTSSHDSWVVWDLNGYLDGISLIKNEMANVEPEESAKHYFFRGQASYDWNVMPGIFRNGMLAHEYDMIRAAYIRNPRDFGDTMTAFEKLAKLQHYGLNKTIGCYRKSIGCSVFCVPDQSRYIDFRWEDCVVAANRRTRLF